MRIERDFYLVDGGIVLSILVEKASNCCLCFFHFDDVFSGCFWCDLVLQGYIKEI